ncbi:MAG: hypothetical protein DRI77_02945 [Chloroflexi bacterium]|nr:MAG: hypothetical protein B6I34_08185 [Anaerolineaceae bacterium 4572_32.1]RLC99362.1 MAG: hypothetical protein DRI77_02945 [Chloroflexota bacterium]
MERLRRFWNAFRDVAIIFSFAVNFILVVSLLVVSIPALHAVFDLKAGLLEPLLSDLDDAFVKLGEAEIDTPLPIEGELAHIKFTLPLSQSLPIDFELDIEQDTNVVLQQEVRLNGVHTEFDLGNFGKINGDVTLSLPKGMLLPVHLDMTVPVSKTISVNMNVPVDQSVPITMTVPVYIKLGEAGLGPAVQDLRAVFRPVQDLVDGLPDGIELGSK